MTAGSAHIADNPADDRDANDRADVTDRFAGIDTRLYLVTDSAQCEAAGRSVAETVAEAVAGGVGIVQVRDKDIDDGDFYSLTRQVIAAVDAATRDTDRTVPVVLNDRVEVARRLNDEGENVHIHVGQTRHHRRRGARRPGCGTAHRSSAANSDEFAAARDSGVVDLVGIGPVFDTSTKSRRPRRNRTGPSRRTGGEAGIPAVAIGGINADRAPDLKGRGLIGICGLGDLHG